jgi:hypothetical protein
LHQNGNKKCQKLLAIIEHLFANDATFLTSNYLLDHTSAEKRQTLVKAASSKNFTIDMHRNLHNTEGLTEKHKKYFAAVFLPST